MTGLAALGGDEPGFAALGRNEPGLAALRSDESGLAALGSDESGTTDLPVWNSVSSQDVHDEELRVIKLPEDA
eukprot:6178877-Pleurochrysis_carterae.AAC.6